MRPALIAPPSQYEGQDSPGHVLSWPSFMLLLFVHPFPLYYAVPLRTYRYRGCWVVRRPPADI
jgi:hypothetical protein